MIYYPLRPPRHGMSTFLPTCAAPVRRQLIPKEPCVWLAGLHTLARYVAKALLPCHLPRVAHKRSKYRYALAFPRCRSLERKMLPFLVQLAAEQPNGTANHPNTRRVTSNPFHHGGANGTRHHCCSPALRDSRHVSLQPLVDTQVRSADLRVKAKSSLDMPFAADLFYKSHFRPRTPLTQGKQDLSHPPTRHSLLSLVGPHNQNVHLQPSFGRWKRTSSPITEPINLGRLLHV
ncbi:hypothetical protein LX36DRAFT_308121 [Colletotrichum falcatum]|nr:hypothetical protein LX36DRAFT_308121 [Colletotrichum falcatum]